MASYYIMIIKGNFVINNVTRKSMILIIEKSANKLVMKA
jgi:hypothetical protein